MKLRTLFAILPVLLITTIANGQMISVNFHVGDDVEGQDSHVFDGTETAGLADFNTAAWNNVAVGNGGTNEAATEIFAPVMLSDDSGNATAAMLSSTLVGEATESQWFVGYAASSATQEVELTNGIGDDNLFNSYLALNGPSGDGSPPDAFVLDVAGLGAVFTDGGYDLIIYSDSDRRGASNNNARTSFFDVTAGGETTTVLVEDDDGFNDDDNSNTFNGTYVVSDGVGADPNYSNFVVVSGLTAADFTIEVTASNAGGRGAISGFQIVVSEDVMHGDVNLDDIVNFLDIAPFISVLATGGSPAEEAAADCNMDGVVSFLDISPFITALAGGGA